MKLYERIIGILIFKLVCLTVLQKEIENKREIILCLLIIFVQLYCKKTYKIKETSSSIKKEIWLLTYYPDQKNTGMVQIILIEVILETTA